MDPTQLQLLQMLSGNPNIGGASPGGMQAPVMPQTPQQLATPYQATPQLQQQQQQQMNSLMSLFGALPGMQQNQQQQINPNGQWPSPYSPQWSQYEQATMGPIRMMQG